MNLNKKSIKIGNKYGKLTVIRHISVNAYNANIFECVCDCGNLTITAGPRLKSGKTKSCGCLKIHRLKPEDLTFNDIEMNYKYQAKTRDLIWDLTREEFRILILKNCYLCGKEPINKNVYLKLNGEKTKAYKHIDDDWINQSWIKVNGIDRKNNEIGYTKENSFPCCTKCNKMKLDDSYDLFIEHCYTILNFQRKTT